MNAKASKTHVTCIEPAYYEAITEAIRKEAVQILKDETVVGVVGYLPGRRKGTASPALVTTAEEAGKLIFSPACVNNLSVYLTKAKKGVLKKGKVGIVAKGCDMRALAGLITESQLQREELFIIGVVCPGVYGFGAERTGTLTEANIARKCRECSVHLPDGADVAAGTHTELADLTPEEAEEMARIEAMPQAERWAFWKEHFSRCIRCMACRQVCPFCYCEQCLCDKNRPQAVESSPRPAGNMAWHLVRAMHLAGRCGGCAECERVCPMDIPLNLLNRRMAKELKELYDFEAGLNPVEKGPLNQYKEDDDQSFIK
ncbi:4Fe-4S dicluster domain-containing protein [Geomonas sp. Red69]|uniref:4Fe-4S dicluster domain-containing protein n=1 Tax=Geomonas diazotrophica TaxID=2843197 RepID=A0ABX8JGA8_9BACT|nr:MULTISPECIES: 4Fe-4S dicluster domain-containing protein [Geomonas]MBU5638760.1 4Fe-4S dicluster domain-containing protein [Geomonas diazotrophica]QWV97400.1 4Fe-4S dicluster domain-containing protein [Geomonas nitrogeniifigens]QXE86558.1 4Fe-4S dicluster domain-containing protein [Geomonas nitrogeniifigens]